MSVDFDFKTDWSKVDPLVGGTQAPKGLYPIKFVECSGIYPPNESSKTGCSRGRLVFEVSDGPQRGDIVVTFVDVPDSKFKDASKAAAANEKAYRRFMGILTRFGVDEAAIKKLGTQALSFKNLANKQGYAAWDPKDEAMGKQYDDFALLLKADYEVRILAAPAQGTGGGDDGTDGVKAAGKAARRVRAATKSEPEPEAEPAAESVEGEGDPLDIVSDI